jgi:hypothetical protein
MNTGKRFCPFCGRQNLITYKYCSECGFEIPKAEQNSYSNQHSGISIPTSMNHQQKNIYVQQKIRTKKSLFLAVMLTIFFGPFGLLYATINGGLTMIFSPIALSSMLFVGFHFGDFLGITAFFGSSIALLFIIPFYWIICIFWSIIAVSHHNSNIERHLSRF